MFTALGGRTFTMGALGYTIEHPVLQDWREAGRQMVTADLYYFFGPWKDKKICLLRWRSG